MLNLPDWMIDSINDMDISPEEIEDAENRLYFDMESVIFDIEQDEIASKIESAEMQKLFADIECMII